MSVIQFLDKCLDRLSSYALVTGVFLMLTLAVLTIFFRWMDTSFSWMEPAVRHLVFICTFLGGVVATGRGSHISIDILERFLENRHHEKAKIWLKRFILIVAAAVMVWLVKASWSFTLIELEYGKNAFLGIHSGYLVGIIPVGFTLIGVRFFLVLLLSLGQVPLNDKGEQHD